MSVIDAVCNVWTPEVLATRPRELQERLRPFYEHYIGMTPSLQAGITEEDMVAQMDRAGVDRALLIAPYLGEWHVPYETVAAVAARFPGRFWGLAGVNPTHGMRGVRALERAVRDLGFVGAHVYPHWFGLPPNDRRYYPFYAKCAELNVPIQIQIGHSAQAFLRTVAPPMTLDEVAIDFPELILVGIHIGWPWVTEAIAVAAKHPNVYLGCDAHAPRHWEPQFVRFVDGRGRGKVLFGTDFPILTFDRALAEIDGLNLREEARRALLWEVTDRLYRLN